MRIRPLQKSDLSAVKDFADRMIGRDYFTPAELDEVLHKSVLNQTMCSFVLVDEAERIFGFRLAYPPTTWSHGKSKHLSPHLWRVPLESAGYFQSLFIATEVQGHGWGPRLSNAALAALKTLGTKAIVTHAWKESPNNSSLRYLSKFGFEEVTSYPHYWIDVDYECVLDGKPCRCTAVEMIKYLEDVP